MEGVEIQFTMADDFSEKSKCNDDRSPRLQELIDLLADSAVQRRGVCARASNICKICGNQAIAFHSELTRFEYRISGICQGCQDHYFA